MALLYDARFRALDSSGNPLVGATLTINTANTSNPASVYSDVGLSVPLTNPTSGADVSDAGGWFPQIFAAEGTVVDITLKNAAGTTIKTYVDVTFLGADTGDFTRTVTGSGRIKITGAAGAVYIQAGSASPDDTGGDLTIEGWAGTQLETLTLDGALVNVTGRIKENSRKLSGTVQTEATTFTAQSTQDIPLTNSPTGVRRWRVTIFDLFPSTNSQPRLKISYNGSVKGGASDYAYDVWYYSVSGTAYARGFDDAHTHIDLSGDVFTNQTNKPSVIVLEITTPNSGNDATTVHWRGIQYTNEGTPRPATVNGAGFGLGNYGRADAIQLSGSAGTWTGKYVVEALYGFGD